MSKMSSFSFLVATIAAAALFAFAGIGKIMGNEMMLKSFSDLGLPTWFGLLIGVCEVAGAVGLLIRPLSGLAAGGLFLIMLGAIYYHVSFPPLSAALPAIILLVITGWVFSRRRSEILRF